MKREILLRASSDASADMLHFCGMFVPDAFFAFTHRGKKCALLSPLELGRAVKESSLDVFYDFAECSRSSSTPSDETAVLRSLLASLKIRALLVPQDFPALHLEKLRALGLDVEVCRGEIFPEREIKNTRQAAEIAKANRVAAACYARAEEILRESKISGRRLLWRKKTLTSEALKFEMEIVALSMGAEIRRAICACGNQACDPHNEGSGTILPNSLIVMDVFPRLKSSGYFGDMTRTFLRGRPNGAQERLVKTVMKAQKLALKKISAGVAANSVHDAVADFFDANNYPTEIRAGRWCGFFHGTGHGVGLEIHEAPRLGRSSNILKEGCVVTVEPGLYYHGLGGCRIEDCVQVVSGGAKPLSKYHYNWVL